MPQDAPHTRESTSRPSSPIAAPQRRASNSWTLERGARPLPDGAVRFCVWAPNARRAVVRVLSGAAIGDHPLEASAARPELFAGVVRGVGAGAQYVYLLDDDPTPLPDPVSRRLPAGVHGATCVVDPEAFVWSDDGWHGIPMRDLVIYELHVGTFTAEGTFGAVIPHLAELAALGVTAVELMPVAAFPGTRNWGYDGVSLYAVQESYGGPEELKRLVDAAHARGLAVVLDVVYNHLGPEGNYLDRFGPYFTGKYTTPWGRALNYDDAHSDEVRRYMIDNALHWVTEYHVDALRLDAVHGIFDFSATHLLQEIAGAVHAQGARLGRRVLVIGESDLNDPKLLRRTEEFGYGLDGQWSDDFHHAVHAALTGERTGYYADFGGHQPVAEALGEPFVFNGSYSGFRKRRHGAPSVGLPREQFVVAVQNHDQVGNRAVGERLGALVDAPRERLAAALLLLSPYVPLLFMGEEYGETNPFLYFVSHGDPDLTRAVREGRRREFESFGWGDEVPDPASEETFLRSKLDRTRMREPRHAQLLALHRALLALRGEEPALRPDGATCTVTHGEGWVALLREGATGPNRRRASDPRNSDRAFLALFNCSEAQRCVPVGRRSWRLRLTTDDPAYGGEGRVAASPDGGQVDLPPWTAVLYEAG